ncbi:hypothetical protein JWV37_06255 [Sulfurospirillum sp. T05]|uniref:Uncharacterized protein n=1 Tax=Sulfurospirillum tamanense TaxID=2813362 RepID=A0ABS2WRV7_9BACT|nr:hypothetical protein [Sulfurospirillum tamanensis]MBN2964375.1 hypothetical protein [Sulfurospirillum tamanensis]
MAIVSYYVLIGKSSGLVIVYSLCYLFIKFVVSFVPFFYEFNFAGPLITFNALAFIFFFLLRVLSFNDINIFKINTSKEVKKSFSDFITKLIALVLIIPFGFGLFLYTTNNLHTTPYRSKNFWSNFENKNTTLPLANFSILFSPAKIERMSEENKYNFDLVQQKRITEKYKNVFGEENNFFDQNLTHFSIPHGEKALIFLFDGEHVVSVYAHVDELANEVKKIYDVGYVEIKP